LWQLEAAEVEAEHATQTNRVAVAESLFKFQQYQQGHFMPHS